MKKFLFMLMAVLVIFIGAGCHSGTLPKSKKKTKQEMVIQKSDQVQIAQVADQNAGQVYMVRNTSNAPDGSSGAYFIQAADEQTTAPAEEDSGPAWIRYLAMATTAISFIFGGKWLLGIGKLKKVIDFLNSLYQKAEGGFTEQEIKALIADGLAIFGKTPNT